MPDEVEHYLVDLVGVGPDDRVRAARDDDGARVAQQRGEPAGGGLVGQDAVLLPGDGDASGPRITFNKVPEPKTVKNRLHLDVVSDTFDAETERLLSLGAQRIRDVQRDKFRWTTFADIEGNEFDLIAG